MNAKAAAAFEQAFGGGMPGKGEVPPSPAEDTGGETEGEMKCPKCGAMLKMMASAMGGEGEGEGGGEMMGGEE